MASSAAASQARARTTVLLNLASILEKADEQVLPAVYLFIMRSLNCTPSQLGTLTLCRALVQALSSPISGVLGDKYDRTSIISLGAFLWGIMTFAIGLSTSIHQAMVWSAINGVGLALVIPCIQSLIADYNPPERRGTAFGTLFFVSSMGGMVGGFFGTNVGHFRVLGMEGWRLAFHMVASVSLLTSFLVRRLASDPRRKGLIGPLLMGDLSRKPSGEFQDLPLTTSGTLKHLGSSLRQDPPRGVRQQFVAMYADVMSVMRIRTFQVLILQGVVGTTPWNALVFGTLWLQLLGFSDLTASSLMALFAFGCALGAFAGGWIGDAMAKWSPSGGRIMAAQFSVCLGLPLSALWLKGLPVPSADSPGVAWLYACVMFVFGCCISWCGSNNSAMFAEIVPEELRSTVYAFDRSFEGGVAACAMPVVGLIAERVFGFSGTLTEGGGTGASHLGDAAALSSSLLVCLMVPWTLCLIFYTGLYRFYPRDRRRTKDASCITPQPRGARASIFRDPSAALGGSALTRRAD